MLAGRLEPDEFEQRIEHAYAAKTLDELSVLTRDLPTSGKQPPRTRRRMLLPGNRPLAVRFEVREPPAAVISQAMRTVAPPLLEARFQLEQSEATRLVFRRRLFPLWTIAAALFVPFIGLIVLAVVGRETSEVVVSANELERGHTVVDVFGVAPRGVRRAMLELDR